jgi:hypothetical protein
MKEIKLSVNMESWRITNDTINKKEITEEQFHLADKGELTRDDKMEIFGAAVVWGYGLYGYEIYEEDGKYYATWRQGDSCD